MQTEQKEMAAKLKKMAEDFRDSLDIRFNPQLRVHLAKIVTGDKESRDFKTNPLSDNELNAIAQINAKAHDNELGDYYVEQMQNFISYIHKDLASDQRGNISNLMNRLMENIKAGSMANNEKAKKSFQYFQEFMENVNK